MTIYSIGELSKMLKKSVRTLQRWDAKGMLKAQRHPSGRRFYTHNQYLEFVGLKNPDKNKSVVVYCRVSSSGQKKDLIQQKEYIKTFCLNSGLFIDDWLEDIGSGLNYKRKNFIELMNKVEKEEIETIIIAHKDRLVRFGFEWFDKFCENHSCKIKIINNDSLSPQEEMTKDLMSIIHCFSSKLYGLRKYKKEIMKLSNEKEI
jgi:predicted site-specific integrase-resolvase